MKTFQYHRALFACPQCPVHLHVKGMHKHQTAAARGGRDSVSLDLLQFS